MQRKDFAGLVHIRNCPDEERSWHFLRLGVDTILLANWYRPGSSPHDNFACLYADVSEFYREVSGICIAGDLNVHHKKWLKYSNADTAIGTDLKAFCDFHALRQIAREPNRKEHLLDSALTDIQKSTASATSYIADHKGALIKVAMPKLLELRVQRKVWGVTKADWKMFLRGPLAPTSWA